MITARGYRRSTVPLQTYPKNNLAVKAVRRRMKVPREVSNDCNATAVKLFFLVMHALDGAPLQQTANYMSATNALINFDMLFCSTHSHFFPTEFYDELNDRLGQPGMASARQLLVHPALVSSSPWRCAKLAHERRSCYGFL